jgi:inorganic pyrophosphatase
MPKRPAPGRPKHPAAGSKPRLDRLPPLTDEGQCRAVIETPRGCRNKYRYDAELQVIVLGKTLPEGMVFPFDFGFLPQTKGEDGDPLDILVFMDEPTFPGCLVECRIVGVMKAKQKEKGQPAERNDRFLGVAQTSLQFQDIKTVEDLSAHILHQIEEFFVSYNRLEGKKFVLKGTAGAGPAFKLFEAHRIKGRP